MPVDRRKFVKISAATLSAVAVPQVWGTTRADDKIKVGLVGCGGRGTGAAAQALSADKGVILWAMGDAFSDRLQSSLSGLQTHEAKDRVQVAPERQFTGLDCTDGVLSSGVDVVLLCSPPAFRPAQLEKAVAAGKHIFCEKPMFVDATGYRRVLASSSLAQDKELNLVSGFCWRRSSPERAIYQEILGGRIGDIGAAHSTYLSGPLGIRPNQPGWSPLDLQLRNWQHFTWLAGDIICEQAVHSIDKIAWAMGDRSPSKCFAIGSRGEREELPERGNIYDNFSVVYQYDDGTRCFLHCRQQANCYNDNTDWVTGTKGRASINGWGPTHVIEGEFGWAYPSDGAKPNMYQVEHDELFAAIRAGKAINDGKWMCNSCLMAVMGREAAYTGQELTWEQITQSKQDLVPTSLDSEHPPASPVAHPGKTQFI